MKYLILILSVLLSWQLHAQQNKPEQFTVVFYNVENLFDTQDDPATLDEEFTAASEKAWDEEKYHKKVEDIARVFSSILSKGSDYPEVIGLCEVENKTVLNDLIHVKSISKAAYSFIHEDSPDTRGIDVALLYRPDAFKVVEYKKIPVVFPYDSTETTRDILYVSGKTNDGETFHFFVNHWSSRRDGQEESEKKRIFTAVTLRKEVDQLMNKDPQAKIIIMGDFNDEPTNRSIHELLYANNKRKNASPRELYNLMYDLHNTQNEGTYNFRGAWNMLDQIIVSQPLIKDRSGFHTDYEGGKIFREEWMIYKDESLNQQVPNRTYGGSNYYGGVSDHFPVYVTLTRPE